MNGESNSGLLVSDRQSNDVYLLDFESGELLHTLIQESAYGNERKMSTLWDQTGYRLYGYEDVSAKLAIIERSEQGGGYVINAYQYNDKISNTEGIAGTSWFSRIMPVKFLDRWGYGDYVQAAKAIKYAVDNGADILSNS